MKWKAKKKPKTATLKRQVVGRSVRRTGTCGRFLRSPVALRFGLGLVVVPMLVFGGLYGWSYARRSDAFKITQVAVTGQLIHLSAAEIRHAVMSHLNGSFFSLSLDNLVHVVKANPWVASVSFRKIFPNKLDVAVEEQKPVARFGSRGVVTTEGVIFYPSVTTLPEDLPELVAKKEQVLQALQFLGAIQDVLAHSPLQLTKLSWSETLGWTVHLVGGVTVILGSKTPILRFERFVRLYSKIRIPKNQQLKSVDLRYPNGFAVHFSDPVFKRS